MDALAITNCVLAVSGMVATALTIASVLFGKGGGMVMSLLVKPASMGKDGLSGWAGPLVTVGGWLGMVLGSHQDPTFSVFSDLSLFFGALLIDAFRVTLVAAVVLVVVSDMQTYIKLRSQQAPSPAAGVHSSTRPRVAQRVALFNEVPPAHASLHSSLSGKAAPSHDCHQMSGVNNPAGEADSCTAVISLRNPWALAHIR